MNRFMVLESQICLGTPLVPFELPFTARQICLARAARECALAIAAARMTRARVFCFESFDRYSPSPGHASCANLQRMGWGAKILTLIIGQSASNIVLPSVGANNHGK